MRSSTVSPIVYIVDDDPSVRQSLVLWLGMRGHRTQEFGSGEEFLAEIRPDSRGCAIVDVRLTGIDGLELQNRLREREIRLPLLFVTGHGDVSTARTALKGGAFDFIEKPIDSDHLVEVVAAALAEDRQRAQESAQVAQLRERIARLTRREREVMEQVVAGRHNREIAAQLGISPRTVEVYKARLMDKLDVQRVADLVKLAIRNHEAATEEHDAGHAAAQD
jgi:RNA polymerase sigma factor (sigma-70 family)